ncbi:MAG: FAD binding domain-containing protein [Alphaproteobacteria bacterium]|nr:FAD binding domain-containing protein [Alphaproteobacteria bacterium]
MQPHSLAEALQLLAGHDAQPFGGGTDIYPAHVGRPVTRDLVSLRQIEELRVICDDGDHVRIGGSVTWSEILRSSLPPTFAALAQAAREVGSVQIQNCGTIAGNLCNASPAADGVPPLLVLDASVELTSLEGKRRVKLAEFLTGYRKTSIRQGEVLSAVLVPKSKGASAFVKLGSRRYLVISIVMAAALVERAPDGTIIEARVSVGAASPVARRLLDLEQDLVGLSGQILPSTMIRSDHLNCLVPIDDVRATAGYRQDAAIVAIGRALDQAWGVKPA